MNLRETILDSLVDDVRSIVEIESYLKAMGQDVIRELVKQQLDQLILDESIIITFPRDSDSKDFINASVESVTVFWFELTDKGKTEWETIELEDEKE